MTKTDIRGLTKDSTADDVLAGIDLAGRRAVVTGAASGIGVETARALAGTGRPLRPRGNAATSATSPARTAATLSPSSTRFSRSQSLPGVPVGRAPSGSGEALGSSTTGSSPARSAASRPASAARPPDAQ